MSNLNYLAETINTLEKLVNDLKVLREGKQPDLNLLDNSPFLNDWVRTTRSLPCLEGMVLDHRSLSRFTASHPVGFPPDFLCTLQPRERPIPPSSAFHERAMPVYAILAIAIFSEVVGTLSLKASEGFTRPGPSLVVIVAYGLAFYFLSLTLRSIPVGVAYAVWSGIGVTLVALIGWLIFGQKLDVAAVFGMGLIIAGVIVLNLFSNTAQH
ncbi:multidrug transporter EmrE-like cation transporter [Ochrobactrum daejeonense]|uniref:Multidrug transporter EmrE-like cation transporter n=2 Tax=Brucella daejeonensis TaxID=659015 RepID=A0A7W9AWD6_9HYPH|nr:multidrug transporter EmrE-like cation transporter [Brucella daejeonensis]